MSVGVIALVVFAGMSSGAGAQDQQGQAPDAGGAKGGVVLDTVSVTATKTSMPVIDVLGGASVVSAEDIYRTQADRISELLYGVPGVSTQISANNPMQSIGIRGLQDFGRVNVLVDGARQDYQISGHNANGSFFLDPEFISQIDVVRGPIANIYGSGAIGGVASFSTRGIDDILDPGQTWGIEQKVGFETNNSGIVTSTSLAKRFGTMADICGQFVLRNAQDYHDGSGLAVPDTAARDLGGLIKVNLHPADGQTISLSALAQKFDFDNAGTSGVGTRFSNVVETGTYTFGYKYEQPDNPWLSLSSKVYFTQTSNEQTVIKPDATYAALGVVPGDKLSDKIDTFGFDINNTSRFTTASFAHALTYGIDGAFDKVATADQAGGFVSALTPSGDRRLLGGFVQDEVRYNEWLRVLGGLRLDNYELNGGGFNSSGTRLSPKITVGVTPVKGVEFYGTYAEGYRAPSVTETLISGTHPFPAFTILANPALKPEIGRNLEGGVNLKFDDVLRGGDSFRAKATGFINNVDDYIDLSETGNLTLVPFIPGMPVSVCQTKPQFCFPISSFQYTNVAKARLSGVELEAAYDWGGGFVSLAATHVDGKNLVTNGSLNTVAPDKASTTLGLRFLDDRLTLGGRVTVVSASEKDVDTPSKGYGLVDLFGSYKYDERISGAVAIDNVFNRQYTPFLSSDASSGLTAKFSLTVKLAGS